MFIIQDILVSEAVFSQKFHCALEACKGACCWKGDCGAPLESSEHETIQSILPIVKELLPEENQKYLETSGYYYYEKENGKESVSYLEDGACVFLLKEKGIGVCAFEKAYEAGLTSFKKPISCHLYPLRVEKSEVSDFECINYDEWDICKAACKLGDSMNLPVFSFVKEALIRKYGAEFYEELHAAANFSEKVEED